MFITFVARKVTLKDAFKERVNKKIKKLDRFFDDEAQAVVTVTVEKDRQTVEVTVKAHSMIFRAEKTTPDMYDSLEAAVDSIVKQIVRNKERLEKRLKSNAFEAAELEEAAPAPKLVRSKKFSVKPMSTEEAILQMEMLGHEFFVFRNAATDEVDVVYKRKDGNYGLIETFAE